MREGEHKVRALHHPFRPGRANLVFASTISIFYVGEGRQSHFKSPPFLMSGTKPMGTFWSELKFWGKRRVKAWSLVFGVPLCAANTYLLADTVRNTMEGIRLSRQLHESAHEFYVTTGFISLFWLVSVLLTVLKALTLLRPAADNPQIDQVDAAAPDDSSTWPPRPKLPQ